MERLAALCYTWERVAQTVKHEITCHASRFIHHESYDHPIYHHRYRYIQPIRRCFSLVARRLILYIILAWIGFWIGHLAGNALDWTFFSLGPLRLGTATLGAAITLGVGYWLSLVER